MTLLQKLAFAGLLSIFTVACHGPTNTAVPFEKTIITPEHINNAISHQQTADQNQNIIPKSGENWFKVIQGTEQIIISAPHATQPFRNGKYRFSDGGGTAALAIMLGELTHATVIASLLQAGGIYA